MTTKRPTEKQILEGLDAHTAQAEFGVQAIREKSARVIEEADVIRLDNEAFNGFMAACEADTNPNDALWAAQRRRKQRVDNGEINRGDAIR